MMRYKARFFPGGSRLNYRTAIASEALAKDIARICTANPIEVRSWTWSTAKTFRGDNDFWGCEEIDEPDHPEWGEYSP